ncbi:MAG: PAS domain-containing sensor histidine kinase [Candidatus Aminicenantes bacterium]|nr:PAS domain-containing sensor histidine kinase [Candidatus Aminicenantes bacterium]
MARKPTYEELEQRIKKLEKEAHNRKQAEEALRESEERYRTLYENVPVGVYRTTPEGKIISANSAAIKIWGYDSEEDLLTHKATDLYDKPKKRLGFIERLINKENAVEFEVKFKRKDGSTFWGSLSATRVITQDVSFSHIDGILQDISERKRIERLRNNVQHMMRHDLKSPLIGIDGLARMLLKDNQFEEKHSKTIGMIIDLSERVIGFIDRTRDLFQMEEGKYKLKPKEVNLFSILKRVEKELRPLALKRRINFTYAIFGQHADPETEYMIMGEEKLLEIMFANLIKNAIEASHEGGNVSISIEAMEKTVHAFHLIHIQNMGAVPMDIRKHFFEPYITSGKEDGTGLGTHSALLIAQAHKGDINFTTSEVDGTRRWSPKSGQYAKL